MRLTSIASLSAALLLAAPVTAQTSSQAGTAATSAAQAKPTEAEKKICKRLATSGSRMEPRVCLTKEEWKQVEKELKN